MKRIHMASLVFALVIGASAYLASDAWYMGVGVGAVALMVALLYLARAITEFSSLGTKRHECYLFMHSYLVTLSVTNSLERAFEVASEPMGSEFHHLDDTLAAMGTQEKAEYLTCYFESDLYRMFLSLLRLYLERGGDVLRLSAELTAESSRVEEAAQSYGKSALAKGMSFAFLWLISLFIMVFVRFGLSSFFSSLSHNLVYLSCLGVYFAFFLASTIVYAKAHTGVKVFTRKRKVLNDEKTA